MHSPTHIRFIASTLALPLVLAACALPEILGGNTDQGAVDSTSEATGDPSTGSASASESGPQNPATTTVASESGEPETATSTAASESGEPETATSTAAPESTTTSEPVTCSNPAHQCTIAIDCEEKRCGELGSPFDADGCLRRSCDDAPCGPGEVCYMHDVGGGCSPTVTDCFDVEDACVCNLNDDCGAFYCYPAGDAPPAQCHQITDETTCLADGCSLWDDARRVSVVDQACSCGDAIGACLWFPGVPGVTGRDPGFFYDLSTHQVVRFPMNWIDAPLGYAPCTGDPSEPPACACAAPGEDPCG